MSAALYIVLASPEPGFDPFVNGKALSRNDEAVTRLAVQLGVTPLMEFFSASPEALAGLVADVDLEPGAISSGEREAWFEPDEGLRTVRALLEASAQLPPGVREDLLEFENVLAQAAGRGLKWHLTVDY